MATPLRVLIVEDSEDDALLLSRELRRGGFDPTFERVDTPTAMRAALDRQPWNLVIADYAMPGFSGLDALRIVQEQGLDVPFIIVSGTIGEETAVAAMRAGAHDYIMKGNLARLAPAVERELREAERRRAHQRTEDTATRLGRILEDSLNELYIFDAETLRFIQVNRGARRNLGYSSEELRCLTPLDLKPEFTPGSFAELIRPLRDGDKHTVEFTTVHKRKDGSQYPVEVHLQLSALESAPVLVALVLDISERKRAEEERTRLVTAIEQAAEVMVITDSEGTIQYVNPAFETITGYTRAEAIGQSPRILKSERHDQAFYRKLWETITRGEVWAGHFTNKRKDGTLYEEEATISPVRDESGRITNFVAVKRDVTREVELERQLNQAQKMEAVGQLASGVAHDFNNLLTTIFGYTEFARDALAENHAAIASLDRVKEAAEQAAGVTRALLTFSRRVETTKEPVDLRNVVEKSVRLLHRVVPASIELVTDVAGEAPLFVQADGTQLQQVIMNLAINARDAMPEGGTLHIAAGRAPAADETALPATAESQIRLTVSDTGSGMSPEVRARVFEPFFTTKPKGQGTGLGLSIIHGIVGDHAGRIDVESEVGRGTTFTITLPALDAEAASEAPAPSTVTPMGRGELILLAEDNSHVRRIVASSLEALNYQVLQVADGAALLETFERERDRIRLIVSDVDMPKRSGLACLQDIRGGRSQVPVILMMASVEADFEDRLDEHTALLRKPFQVAALGALVGRLCSPTNPTGGGR